MDEKEETFDKQILSGATQKSWDTEGSLTHDFAGSSLSAALSSCADGSHLLSRFFYPNSLGQIRVG